MVMLVGIFWIFNERLLYIFYSRMCLYYRFTTFCHLLWALVKLGLMWVGVVCHIFSFRWSDYFLYFVSMVLEPLVHKKEASQEILLYLWNSRSKAYFKNLVDISGQHRRHATSRGREESLELCFYPLFRLVFDKTKGLRHRNRLAAQVRRRYFSGGEKRRKGLASYADVLRASSCVTG